MRPLSTVVAIALVACGAPVSDEMGTADLIGGDVAAEGDYPGVVAITNADDTYTCTATKVGARFVLTAAHCVVAIGVDVAKPSPMFEPKSKIALAYSRKNRGSRVDVVVKKTHLPDVWTQNCRGPHGCALGDPKRNASPDVAVIETVDEIPQIPTAVVDLDSASVEDRVVILGYGCEDPLSGPFDYSKARLKSGETSVAPPSSLRHRDSGVSDEQVPPIDAFNVITLGPALDPSAPGLCSGDSGGPLLRVGAKKPTVVGINSGGTFATDLLNPLAHPATHWHTRIGASSRVGDFLVRLGVETTHACSESGMTCANPTYPR